MKNYRKRILTWLMVIALLAGSILVDYRVPIFSKANGTSLGGGTTSADGTPSEGTTGTDGTSVSTTGSGDGTTPSLLHGDSATATDITNHVEIKLWNFGLSEQQSNGIKGDGYRIKEGKLIEGAPAPKISVGNPLYFEYKFDVPSENSQLKKEDFFTIQLPDKEFIAVEGTGDVLGDHDQKIGSYSVDNSVLKGTFTTEELSGLKFVRIGIAATAKKATTDGQELKIRKVQKTDVNDEGLSIQILPAVEENTVSSQVATDITNYVKIKLWELGLSEKQSDGQIVIKENGHVIKGGELVSETASNKIYHGNGLCFKYKFDVDFENFKNYVKKDNFFRVKLPAKNIIGINNDVSGEVLGDDGKSIGTYAIEIEGEDRFVKITFGNIPDDVSFIKDGFIEVASYAEGAGENLEIPAEWENGKITPKKIKIYPSEAQYDNAFINEHGDPSELWKSSWQGEDMLAKDTIMYTVEVGLDQLFKDYKKYTGRGTNSLEERQDMIVYDLLPEGLNLSPWKDKRLVLHAPMFFPELKLGTDGQFTDELTGQLSKQKWHYWMSKYPLYLSTNSKDKNAVKLHENFEKTYQDEGCHTWEEFLETFRKHIKDNKNKNSVGFWKGEKRDGIAIHLGDLPTNLTYGEFLKTYYKEDLATVIKKVKNHKLGKKSFKGNLMEKSVTDGQIEKMVNYYTSAKIRGYCIYFYGKTKSRKSQEYENTVHMQWKIKSDSSSGNSSGGQEKKAESTDRKTYGLSTQAGWTYGTETINLRVEKLWNNKKEAAPAGIDQLTFKLLENEEHKNNRMITLKAADGWKHTEENLPRTYRNIDIRYSLEEISPNGYEASVGEASEIDSSTKTITIKVENTELRDITVQKEWKGFQDKKGPTEIPEIEVNLFEKLSADEKEFIKKLSIKPNAEGKWEKATFSSVPKYKRVGDEVKEIDYIVEEKAVSGYTGEVTGNMENGFTITNTKKGKKIDIQVTKKWVGGTNHPSSVGVELYKDNSPSGKKLNLTANESWTGKFTDLPTHEDGRELIYSVKEQKADGYVSKVTGDAAFGFTVTNTKIKPIVIQVEKAWVDKNGKPLPKEHKSIPDSIKVQLLRASDNQKIGEELTLTKESEWRADFPAVPSTDTDGNPITYKVKEVTTVPGFAVAAEVTPGNDDKAQLVNRFNVETKEIKIEKKWKKYDLSKPNKPLEDLKSDEIKEKDKLIDEIAVDILYRKKGSADEFQTYLSNLKIKKSENWMLTISDWLPKHDVENHELEYDVREVKIPEGYYADLKGPTESAPNTFVLTNTVIPKRTIEVKKQWIGENKKTLLDTEIPDTNITVKLFRTSDPANGWALADELTLNKSNGWKAKFTKELETVAQSGKQYRYRIEEVTDTKGFVHDSTKAELQEDQILVTITNQEELKTVELKVKKLWLDLNNSPITEANRLPDGVKFSLFANGKFEKAFTIEKKNGWSYTESLRKFDDNKKEIVYSITEDPLFGYSSKVEKAVTGDGFSFTVTNKERPGIPFIPPIIPDEPVPTPPNIPTPPAPDVPIDELVIEDDEVALADNEEPELEEEPETVEEAEPEEEPKEDEEITDDLPRANKNVPKTHDFFMNGFANPLAVSTVIMMGYGIKKLVAKKKKD